MNNVNINYVHRHLKQCFLAYLEVDKLCCPTKLRKTAQNSLIAS